MGWDFLYILTFAKTKSVTPTAAKFPILTLSQFPSSTLRNSTGKRQEGSSGEKFWNWWKEVAAILSLYGELYCSSSSSIYRVSQKNA